MNLTMKVMLYLLCKLVNLRTYIPCQVKVEGFEGGGSPCTSEHWQFHLTLSNVPRDSVQDHPMWILDALHMLLLFFPDGAHLYTEHRHTKRISGSGQLQQQVFN